MLTLDLETRLIARAQLAPKPICMAWKRPEVKSRVQLIDDTRDLFQASLRSGELLVNQAISYDLTVLGEYWRDLLPGIFEHYDNNLVESVDINQKIIDIAVRGDAKDEYSLERLSERYGLPAPDKSGPWRTEFTALEGIQVEYWPQGAIDYCLDDSDKPEALYFAQHDYDLKWQSKTGYPLLHLAGQEAYKDFCLRLASCWGIKTNGVRVEALRKELLDYLGVARTKLVDFGLVRADGSKDTAKAKARMASVVTHPALTATGEISLDKQACEEAKDETLKLYSEYSQAGTLLSKVNDLAQGVVLPLQTRFNSLLNTSRTSSSKPALPIVGCQCQNFPRKIGARETLEPRPGHVFVLADYSIAELHSLAQVCIDWFGQSVLADILNSGKDVHVWFGGHIVGEAYEDLLARVGTPEGKHVRDTAKPCNFGIPGGMGAEKFAAYAWAQFGVLFSEAQARDLINLWIRTLEMRPYFNQINKLMGGRDHAITRHGRSGRWRGRVPYCALCNTQFQELTATAAAFALCEVQKRCYTGRQSALFDSRMVLFTHDEIVLETPEECAHEAALELSQVMADRFNQYHPDCPTQADPVVTRVYSKKAKKLTDANGRLIPYEG